MNFQAEAHHFLESSWKRLSRYHKELKPLSIDHLCYRTTSPTHYEQTKRYFGELGIELIESMIAGRPIATFKLHEPIHFRGFQIDLVEVPAPKEGKATKDGLEHFEFVIPYHFDWVRELFKNEKISEKGTAKQLNPEIEVSFEDFAIKFHHKSLEEVIAIEKHPKLCDLIDSLGLFSELSQYCPLISGTIPLQIHHEHSDLDILCQASDLDSFERTCTKSWGEMNSFRIHRAKYNNKESSIVNFSAQGLEIEIFCQDQSVFTQNANRHYYAESKLLKILGKKFRREISELKKSGVKTEPAFGELLGLNSPYEELLKLALLSEEELAQKFKDYSS